jgi:transcriptional regulator with XRE-family HTH domain
MGGDREPIELITFLCSIRVKITRVTESYLQFRRKFIELMVEKVGDLMEDEDCLLNIADIGERIRESRERAGIGQKKFARLVGYSVSWIGRIERGEERPSGRLVRTAERRLGVDLGSKKYIVERSGKRDCGLEWMTPTEVSEFLGIHRTEIYRMMDSDELSWEIINGFRRIKVSACVDASAKYRGCLYDGVTEERDKIVSWLKVRRDR